MANTEFIKCIGIARGEVCNNEPCFDEMGDDLKSIMPGVAMWSARTTFMVFFIDAKAGLMILLKSVSA